MIALTHLHLQDYRNYSHLQLLLSEKINVIYGLNAQGKSNLVEAIAYLATGRSYRGHQERDIVRHDAAYFVVEGELSGGSAKNLKITWNPKDGKTFFLDRQLVKGSRNYLGRFHAVVFEPRDVLFFQDEPRARRAFLDDEIAVVSPSYEYALQQYQILLKERNEILKSGYDEILDCVLIERLIALGMEIRTKRLQFLNKLEEELKIAFAAIYDDQLPIAIQYLPNVPNSIEDSHQYEQYWKGYADTEKRVQQTQVGPHRDDFIVLIDGKNIAVFGSQGQQRIAVVALKLALIRYIQAISGVDSVVLLDDVLSELDTIRRQRLLNEVKNHHQVIITLTQPEVIHASLLDDVKFIEVKQGKVITKEK